MTVHGSAIIVRFMKDFKWAASPFQVITARHYLDNPTMFPPKTRIVNLGRNYEYLGHAYYCSLLAEARQHRVIPSVRTLLELRTKRLYAPLLGDLEAVLAAACRRQEPPRPRFGIHIFFGHSDMPQFQRFGRRVYELFRAPILRVDVHRSEAHRIRSIRILDIDQLPEDLENLFEERLREFVRADWSSPRKEPTPRHMLAILHDPKAPLPPSNEQALRRFIRAGESMGLGVELVQRKDLSRLAEYDALFIRETTGLTDHTYQFAQRAEREGLVVIDDPASIMRCTNKVYLAELLRRRGIPTPKTLVVSRRHLPRVLDELPLPLILKIPDGSFSRGVHKVESRSQFEEVASRLLDDSDLILAQEFMYTQFDWRVGVLNGKALFVCQYHMARHHWQIVSHGPDGSARFGGFETFAVDDAPPEVVNTAVKAAALIGDGLYGVDLKQTDRGVFVIEINDNPSIDHGVEDRALKDKLYELIMQEFLRRLDRHW
ncbi:RimK family protein [Candidatus Fermentibacteria bacterium]|nr:RimK family protein [Candidatus Fermentibacteria bacterium]